MEISEWTIFFGTLPQWLQVVGVVTSVILVFIYKKIKKWYNGETHQEKIKKKKEQRENAKIEEGLKLIRARELEKEKEQ